MDDLNEVKKQMATLQSQIDRMTNAKRSDEAATAAPAVKAHRIIHVRVAGSPTIDVLKQVADIFNRAIASNTDVVVPTNLQVDARVLAVDPQNPIQGLVVKAVADIGSVIGAAYAAYAALPPKKALSWTELPARHQEAFAEDVLNYLSFNDVSPAWEDRASVTTAVIDALRPLLPEADPHPMPVDVALAEVVSGGETFMQWETRDLRELKVNDIFRATGSTEPVYIVRRAPYTNYVAAEGAVTSVKADPLDETQWPRHPDLPPEDRVDAAEVKSAANEPSAEELHAAGVARAEAEGDAEVDHPETEVVCYTNPADDSRPVSILDGDRSSVGLDTGHPHDQRGWQPD
jgi:hypothetical protein